MPVVSAAFGDHVNDATSSAADLRGVAVRRDLEFLHRVLAETVRAATRTGASGRLSEKHIVRVRPVHRKTVGGAALPAEAQIATARWIAYHSRSQHGEIQKVAAVD